MLELYGGPSSQPFRPISWLCLIKELPFEMQHVTIEDMCALKPLAELGLPGQVPMIVDNGFVLAESAAILCYLCRKHGWTDFYPEEVEARGLIDQYLAFHHNFTRRLSVELMGPHVIVAILDELRKNPVENAGLAIAYERAEDLDNKLERGRKGAKPILDLIERAYFKNDSVYLCGTSPSIADLLGYQEVAQLQVPWSGLYDFTVHPKLQRWMDAMTELPHHNTAHAYNLTLGDISGEPNTKTNLRGAAMAGAHALEEVGIEVVEYSDFGNYD